VIVDDLQRFEDKAIGEKGVAVGWLGAQYSSRGLSEEVSSAFFERLVSLLVDPWQPYAVAGVAPCPMCRFSGGPSVVDYQGARCVVRTGMLLVPGPDALYISPTMIAHYVDAHGYDPPQQFVEAVMQCPPMRSMSYWKDLLRLGVSVRAR
jgi:hypothetical protein